MTQKAANNRVCRICGGGFHASASVIASGQGLYCGRKCYHDGRKAKGDEKRSITNAECSWCHKPIHRPSWYKSKTGMRFCDWSCRGAAQRHGEGFENVTPPQYKGPNKPPRDRKYGTISLFRRLRFAAGECAKCGYCRHVEVLQVHHRDGDHSNNVVANLEVLCPTCHSEEHHRMRQGSKSALKVSNLP